MSKFATLDKLRDKEDDEKKNEYYAGGTDGRGGGSGLNVVGPPGNPSNDPMQRIVNNAMNDAKESSSASSSPPENMRKVTLYRNGFTIDDGPLRDLESPENKQFLASLSEGYIPRELQSGDKEVHIGLDDRRGEDYRAPTPPAYVAYSGDAMTLGGSSSTDQAYIFATSPNPIPTVNTSAPTTLIQVKLHNGKKLKLKSSPLPLSPLTAHPQVEPYPHCP